MLGLGWLLVAAAPAQAAGPTAPCLGAEPLRACHVWTGKVVRVSDGDTIAVDLDRDGTRRRREGSPDRHPSDGADALRKATRAGECHGVDATERLEELVAESGGSRTVSRRRTVPAPRLGRAAASGGRSRSSGTASGPTRGPPAAGGACAVVRERRRNGRWNGRYSRLAEEAAARGVGIWDGRSCGTDQLGPAANAVHLKVKWDANGDDGENLDGEWVRIRNTDALHPLKLGGWWFRDSALRRYTFPPGAVVLAGGSIRLRIGAGDEPTGTPFTGDSTGRLSTTRPTTGSRRATAATSSIRTGTCARTSSTRAARHASSRWPARSHSRPTTTRRSTCASATPRTGRSACSSTRSSARPGSTSSTATASCCRARSSTSTCSDGEGSGNAFARSWGQPDSSLSDQAGAVTLRNPLGAPVVCNAWGGEPCPDV